MAQAGEGGQEGLRSDLKLYMLITLMLPCTFTTAFISSTCRQQSAGTRPHLARPVHGASSRGRGEGGGRQTEVENQGQSYTCLNLDAAMHVHDSIHQQHTHLTSPQRHTSAPARPPLPLFCHSLGELGCTRIHICSFIPRYHIQATYQCANMCILDTPTQNTCNPTQLQTTHLHNLLCLSAHPQKPQHSYTTCYIALAIFGCMLAQCTATNAPPLQPTTSTFLPPGTIHMPDKPAVLLPLRVCRIQHSNQCTPSPNKQCQLFCHHVQYTCLTNLLSC
jgi:hypothetical protein